MQPARGKPISIETERFLVRSMTARDAGGIFRAWISNAELMGALNMPPRRLSADDVARFVAGFDDRTRYLVGIFVRKTQSLVGLLLMDVNTVHALVKFSGFIGDRNWRGKQVFEEVGFGLFDELFKERGLEKATAQVWEKNFATLVPLRRIGFKIEGFLRDEIRAFDKSGRRSQFLLGMLASDWKPRKHAD
ncbi:MAG: GNAT family N-acetyltransferase [Parvibaculaceae bacterium]